ncbi:tRNA methyltransferase ppm2, partial [Oleoguttula sp. CCFEE 5521]
YFRYFVNKFKRRSPLINRGYWLRMRAIEHTVQRFLEEPTTKRKLVVNLGCGYDPLPWLFLGKLPHLCDNATFVDVDYAQLMQRKCEVIDRTEQLKILLPGLKLTGKDRGLLAHSTNYVAVGCDLRNLDLLSLVLQDHLQIEDCSVAIMFVAEVSIAYMDYDASQAVLVWAAQYSNVRFCLLEQHLPDGADHPFAQTMLRHFEKLRTPLHAIGTMDNMTQRFVSAGWPAQKVDIKPLWDLWSYPEFLTADQRRALDNVEPFDEWEEFALFGSHYFLLVARKSDADATSVHADVVSRSRAAPDHSDTPKSAIRRTDDHERSGEAAHSAVSEDNVTLVTAIPLDGSGFPRRFAAALPTTNHQLRSAGLLAGLGTKERLSTTDTYTVAEEVDPIFGPPLTHGLMCHTITAFGNGTDCLLVGGRMSPNAASAACWLRRDGHWSQVASLPEGRYRHAAIQVARYPPGTVNGGVLVIGGKTSDGRVLADALLWTETRGWVTLRVDGRLPPARFGANIIPESPHTLGRLSGGMSDDGTVLEDLWTWSLLDDGRIRYDDDTVSLRDRLPRHDLSRFGAQILFRSPRYADGLIIGGITGRGMLTRDTEIVDLEASADFRIVGHRPLLIGHSLADRLVLGGGATCFSFGTHWSQSCYLSFDDTPEQHATTPWRLAHADIPHSKLGTGSQPVSAVVGADTESLGSAATLEVVPRIHLADEAAFQPILTAGQPVILTSCGIGPCITKWTNEYLKDRIGHDREVVVHVSPESKMDFKSKNFTYETQRFGPFLDAVSAGSKLYLRALSTTSPSEAPTNLATDFPGIAPDFVLPEALSFIQDHHHSSPLRISGPVTMWLHYDVMANILCQIRGSKRLLLYPPSDVSAFNIPPGTSSSSIDVFTATPATHPQLASTHPHEVLLAPGEMLYIPPLWLHTAAPTEGMSVAVNVFFRNLEKGYAAGRDVYGNRDLAAYEKGRRDVKGIVKGFEGLPGDVRKFYLERLVQEMRELSGL